MRNSTLIGRVAALAAIVIAVAAVFLILLQGGSTYKVRAIFQNASQIVSGDLVEVAGNSIGTVSDISLTPQGQAQLTLDITKTTYEPLRAGTQATVRQASLSGIANRYVDLLRLARPAARSPAAARSAPRTRPARSTSISSSTRSTRRPARACSSSSKARPGSTPVRETVPRRPSST